MILKKIELNNIRSYTSEVIEFPKGSVLLTGDIGSGKSSILLACEFVLFGIMKGDISGAQLLRHGEKEGFVSLTLEINKKEITIKRTLKRGSSGILQHHGYIISDGVKTDLVATELKARILELLGYSQSQLKKSKSLIYRYTVYTPQEEMKRIILSKPEERIDTLRSVFGIDKYKTIKENSQIYARELKRKIGFAEGQVVDLDEIKNSIDDKKKTKTEITKEIEKQKPIVEKAKEDVEVKKERITQIEKDLEKIREAKNKATLIEQKIHHSNSNIESFESQRKAAKEQISEIEEDIKDKRKVNEEKLTQKISLLKNGLEQQKEKLEGENKKIAELDYIKREAKSLKEKILTLKKCPTCEQEVTPDHKHKIDQENKGKIEDADKKLKELESEKKELGKKIKGYQEKLEEYSLIEKDYEIIKLKFKILEDKKKDVESSQKKVAEQTKLKEDLHDELKKLKKSLKEAEKSEEEFEKLKREFEKIQDIERDEAIKLARLLEQEKSIDQVIKELQILKEQKEKLKNQVLNMKKTHHFLTEYFENLMLSMEKHVMGSIHNEFNDLVKKWFLSLMGDESITIRLDNEFTPILEQNGYETEIENLSGGEKTAVALSYRLALNKVINDMISTINTKDLIILDEPTDGFSTSQLDRVREVIDELDLKQIIIVSHEPEIESFVDSVIRIEKDNHESRVAV